MIYSAWICSGVIDAKLGVRPTGVLILAMPGVPSLSSAAGCSVREGLRANGTGAPHRSFNNMRGVDPSDGILMCAGMFWLVSVYVMSLDMCACNEHTKLSISPHTFREQALCDLRVRPGRCVAQVDPTHKWSSAWQNEKWIPTHPRSLIGHTGLEPHSLPMFVGKCSAIQARPRDGSVALGVTSTPQVRIEATAMANAILERQHYSTVLMTFQLCAGCPGYLHCYSHEKEIQRPCMCVSCHIPWMI